MNDDACTPIAVCDSRQVGFAGTGVFLDLKKLCWIQLKEI